MGRVKSTKGLCGCCGKSVESLREVSGCCRLLCDCGRIGDFAGGFWFAGFWTLWCLRLTGKSHTIPVCFATPFCKPFYLWTLPSHYFLDMFCQTYRPISSPYTGPSPCHPIITLQIPSPPDCHHFNTFQYLFTLFFGLHVDNHSFWLYLLCKMFI